MPAAFIAAVSAAGAGIGGAFGAALVMGSVGIGTALYYAATLAISAGYSGMQKRRAERKARDAYNASLTDRLVMTPLAGGQRSRVYGRVRNVDGVLFKATRGVNSEFYTLVISLAGHEVDAIESIYFDDLEVALDADGYVTTEPYARSSRVSEFHSQAVAIGASTITLAYAPVAGSVHVTVSYGSGENIDSRPVVVSVAGSDVSFTNPFGVAADIQITYQRTVVSSKARVRKFLGGAAQDLSGVLLPLFPSLLTANDRFAGDACLIVDLEYDRDAYPSGVPNISAVMRGAKVYDPRTGTTAWSENPALCARDWAYYAFGGNFPAGTVRDADVIAAANACDVSTSFTTAGGTVAKPLYTCGFAARTDQDPSLAMEEIVESMAGRSGWSGGNFRLRAGVYRAPVTTITEDWVSDADGITIVPEAPVDEALNIIRATIADSAQNYVQAPAPDVRAEAYITLDGRELPRELTYAAVTDGLHAQHISGVILRESRSGLTVTLPCNLRAFPLELFGVVYVTLPRFGWSAKLFEVSDWRFSLEGGVTLTLRETAASIFDVDALFTESDATPNTALPNPFNVPTPAGIATASGTAWLLRQDDGTVTSQLHVGWTPITDAAVVNGGRIELRYGLDSQPESAWTSVELPGGDSQYNIGGVLDGAVYVVKLRARNALVRGDWSLHSANQIVGKTALPATVTGLSATPAQGNVAIEWDENTEADYASTELRIGATWATGALLFKGKANAYPWPAPALGSYTIRAKHWDTSKNESAAEAVIAVTVDADGLVQWVDVSGRPKLFRAVARGMSDTASPHALGLFDGDTDVQFGSFGSGYNVWKINRATGVPSFVGSGMPLSSGDGSAVAALLNSIGADYVAAVFTWDEPQGNRLTGGLPEAMYRCGASRAVFGSPQFQYRGAYVLVGIGGCGEGNGFEAYQGSVASDTNAWCDVAFTVQSGNLIVSGTSATPRTLADYSYTGSLDADRTAINTAAGIAGQGDLATLDQTNTPQIVANAVMNVVSGASVGTSGRTGVSATSRTTTVTIGAITSSATGSNRVILWLGPYANGVLSANNFYIAEATVSMPGGGGETITISFKVKRNGTTVYTNSVTFVRSGSSVDTRLDKCTLVYDVVPPSTVCTYTYEIFTSTSGAALNNIHEVVGFNYVLMESKR